MTKRPGADRIPPYYDTIYRKGCENPMSKITVGDNEPLEKALRRFKKKIEIEGILKTLKARKYYEKPSEKKRRMKKKGGSHRK